MIGTDAVAALEANLDRCPTKEQLWQLLTQWLSARGHRPLSATHQNLAVGNPTHSVLGVQRFRAQNGGTLGSVVHPKE
ncbi:MAG: hypothetical protein JWN13_5298 [Betaproteobacteria bacterium]|nr:hypothetical protein [Betaproteobacteria bacterium]